MEIGLSSSSSSGATASTPTVIRIVTHTEPIKVSYDTVDQLIPLLYDPRRRRHRRRCRRRHNNANGIRQEELEDADDDDKERLKYDFAIHLGMTSSRSAYTLETKARRGPYTRLDVDGRLPSSVSSWSIPSTTSQTRIGRSISCCEEWISNRASMKLKNDDDDDNDNGEETSPEVLSPSKLQWEEILTQWRRFIPVRSSVHFSPPPPFLFS